MNCLNPMKSISVFPMLPHLSKLPNLRLCAIGSVRNGPGLIQMLIKLIPIKQWLHLLVPQHQHIILYILVNSVLWYLLLVLLVVLLNTLNIKKFITTGMYGAFICFFDILYQSTSRSHGCSFSSYIPFAPRRFTGLRISNYF